MARHTLALLAAIGGLSSIIRALALESHPFWHVAFGVALLSNAHQLYVMVVQDAEIQRLRSLQKGDKDA